MATHSSILAWRIPWTEEPGRLQTRGLDRVGHEQVTKHTHRSSQQCSLLIPTCGFLTESCSALSCVVFVFAMGQTVLLSLLLDTSKVVQKARVNTEIAVLHRAGILPRPEESKHKQDALLSNCGAGEDSRESLEEQEDQTSQS